MFIHAGDMVRAEQLMRRARDLGLQVSDVQLSRFAAARGDVDAAVGLWASGTKATTRDFSDEDRKLIAAGMYGGEEARQRALALLDAYLRQPREHVSQHVALALFDLQQPARALEVLRTQQITDTSDTFALLWSRQGRAMRVLPEFGTFIRDFGFTAVWDKYGAPDVCTKRGPGDYACE